MRGYTDPVRLVGSVWDDGDALLLPPGDGAGEARPIAMNDRGQVVGFQRATALTGRMIPTLWEL